MLPRYFFVGEVQSYLPPPGFLLWFRGLPYMLRGAPLASWMGTVDGTLAPEWEWWTAGRPAVKVEGLRRRTARPSPLVMMFKR